jgi:hypothetical protein
VIADQTGSGGTGSNAGAGGLRIAGPGTVILSGANTYTGGVTLTGGTLDLAHVGAAGSGAIRFAAGGAASLQISAGDAPANLIDGFAAGDTIDLLGIGLASGATLTSGNTLDIVGGAGGSVTLDLDPTQSFGGDKFVAGTDDAGGTDIILSTAPALAPLTPQTVEQGQTVEIAVATPGLAGDSLSLLQTAGAGTLALVGNEVMYTAPETITTDGSDSVSYTITEQGGGTIAGTGAITLDAGPAITVQSTGTITPGNTILVGIVTAGEIGDTLSLSGTVTGGGALALDGNEVVYTAPAPIAASETVALSYSLSDQHQDAAAQGSGSVVIDAGPSIAGVGTLTIGHGQSTDITALIGTLFTAGIAGDGTSLSAVTATHGTATLSAGDVQYSAPASGTAFIDFTVGNTFGETATGTIDVTIDPGPTVTFISSTPDVAPGGTLVIGMVTPGLTGDVLSLGSMVATGSLSLEQISGVADLVYVAPTHPTTGSDAITFSVSDSHQDTVSAGASIMLETPPTITGVTPAESILDTATLKPFASVVIGSTYPSETVTVTIALSSTANGSLANLGGGTLSGSTYSITGTAAQDTTAIDELVFTPVLHEVAPGGTVTTFFTLAATDGILSSTIDPTTTLTTTASAAPITLTLPNEYVALNGAASATPISNITITDPNAGATETASVTLGSTTHGTLADPNAATDHSVTNNGTLTITGSAAAVAADLDALLFTPAAGSSAVSTTVTAAITDSDRASSTITSTVLATSPTSAAAGAAGASASATAAASGTASDTAIAQGGAGGAGKVGGAGGAATASASATNAAGPAFATATATGGAGGASGIAGGGVGAAGVASNTTAFASGTTAATASVTQTGGAGGSGTQGVAGLNGASSNLTNAVSGVTNGGTLSLTQLAIGGNGGASDTNYGGDGGTATSSLAFNDTKSAAIFALVEAIGGNAGTGNLYTPYGNTAKVTASVTGAGNVTTTGVATGGIGASGGAAGVGNGGGASAAVTSIATGTATAIATSTGGLAGSSSNGSGMGGGTSTSTTATATGAVAIAQATGAGGLAGAGAGAGQSGRFGAVAAAVTAIATGITAATASATNIGGAGGAGTTGAAGGNGGAANFVNAVTGSTAGGTLTLNQTAIGGAGGNSTIGAAGTGGLALTQLTFNDTLSATQSAAIISTVAGIGGAGGTGSPSGAGGPSWDMDTITGAHAVAVTTNATGGNAGTGGAQGGDAQAMATGTGAQVTITATANAGTGTAIAGIANATATGTGSSGTVTANTHTSLTPGSLVNSTFTTAAASVNGSAIAAAQAGIATTEPWNITDAALATIDAIPVASYTTAITNVDPHTKAALGSSSTTLAVGQLGGAHSSSGATTETSTATADITLNLAKLSGQPDLVLAMVGAVSTGAGVTGVTLSVAADGSSLFTESFSSATAATAYLTDHPIDLGSLASGELMASPTLDLHVALSVTTTQAGGGEYGQFLLGTDTITQSANMNFLSGGGGNEVFVLPAAGNGTDTITGFTETNGDVLDLRQALAATGWNGMAATLANYLKVTDSAGSTILSVAPTGIGAGTLIATLSNGGNLGLSDLLSHNALQT